MSKACAVRVRTSSSSSLRPFNAVEMARSRLARRRWGSAATTASFGSTRRAAAAVRSGPATSPAAARAPARSASRRSSAGLGEAVRKSTSETLAPAGSTTIVSPLNAPWAIRASRRSARW